MTDWAALLDAIDAGLDEFPPVLLDELPGHPGPVPPALVDRAERTLRRMAEVEAALQRDLLDLARELTALSSAGRTGSAGTTPPVPHFLDARA